MVGLLPRRALSSVEHVDWNERAARGSSPTVKEGSGRPGSIVQSKCLRNGALPHGRATAPARVEWCGTC